LVEGLESRRLLAGTPTFTVSFDDRGGAYSGWYDRVRSTVLAAAADWGQYIKSNAKIDLRVDFDPYLTAPTLATAGFDRRVYFGQGNGYQVQIGNVAAELRTGVDQNGSSPDAEISIRPGALDEMYFDATPGRSAAPPDNKIDARSVFLHELGHTLGVFGTGGGPHDSPAGNRLVYDQYVQLDSDGEIYFTGPNAEAAYGGRVPLSHDDSSHIGNDDGPGIDLADDLMAPAIPDGAKRYISVVDLGVVADAGVPMRTALIPQVQAADVTAVRRAGGTATFVLTLSKASGQTVTVPVRTANGSAVAGRDYVALNKAVTFAPGETSKTVSVKLLAGSPFDKDKTFTLNLGTPTNAILLRGDAQATLRNDVVAADAQHTATFTDSTGNKVTVNLRGAGVATVNRDDAGDLETISITGSNAGTVLVIRSKRATVLHGVTAKGGLGGIDAPNTDFSGRMRLAGTNQVTFRDVLAGSWMRFGGSPQQLAFAARRVTDSTIRVGGVIRSFEARAWLDPDDAGDVLKAAGFGTVTVRGELQTDVESAGTIGTLSAGTLRDATVHAKGSVTGGVTVGSAVGSDVLVGTDVFADSMAEFDNRKAVLTAFAVRAGGTFSDTRVAAPVITSAALGAVDVDNGGVVFGVAAKSVSVVSGSTPSEPAFKRRGLKAGQTIREGDFVVRVL
jgi:hypothetical protein